MRAYWNILKVVAVLATVFAAGPTFADFLQPFWAEATSEWGSRTGDKCVGPGLSAASSTATHNTTADDMWLSNNENVATIEFFLNSKYDLTDIYFWNYNEAAALGRGVAEFTVEVSTNRGDTWFNPTSGGTQNPAIGGGTATEPVQTLSMTASAVNAVRFNTVSNHNSDTSYTGISDVGFETTTELRSALPTNEYVTNVTIEAYSSYSINIASRDPTNTINGDGFEPNGAGTHSTSVGDMWLSVGASDPTPFITFDLGDNYDLNSILIWNYAENKFTERGAKEVEIEVASSEGGSFNSLGTFTFFKAFTVDTADYSQVVDLSGLALAKDVRRVRFTINSNYGSEPYFGLSEVRFVRGLASAVGTLFLFE